MKILFITMIGFTIRRFRWRAAASFRHNRNGNTQKGNVMNTGNLLLRLRQDLAGYSPTLQSSATIFLRSPPAPFT